MAGKIAEVYHKEPGEVTLEHRGSNGFGYDPIIIIDSIDKTYAEIEFEQTIQVGFRALALRKLFKSIKFDQIT